MTGDSYWKSAALDRASRPTSFVNQVQAGEFCRTGLRIQDVQVRGTETRTILFCNTVRNSYKLINLRIIVYLMNCFSIINNGGV